MRSTVRLHASSGRSVDAGPTPRLTPAARRSIARLLMELVNLIVVLGVVGLLFYGDPKGMAGCFGLLWLMGLIGYVLFG